MRKIFLFLLFLCSVCLGSAYYIKSTGSAANKTSGTGPFSNNAACMSWATFDACTQVAGDTFHFYGPLVGGSDVYRDTLKSPVTGTVAAPIVFNGNGVSIYGSTALDSGATYTWAESSTPYEYYCTAAGGGDPSLSKPLYVWINGVNADTGKTKGALKDHQSGWGDNDGLGYNTLYIKDFSGNPKTIKTNIEVNNRVVGITITSIKHHLIYKNFVVKYVASTSTTGFGVTISGLAATDTSIKIIGCTIDACGNGISSNNASQLYISNCIIKNIVHNDGIKLTGNGINDTIIYNSIYNTKNYGLQIITTEENGFVFTANNSVYGVVSSGFYAASGAKGKYIVKNSNFLSIGYGSAGSFTLRNAASATCSVHVDHTVIPRNAANSKGAGATSINDLGYNFWNINPKIRHYRYTPFIVIGQDDNSHFFGTHDAASYGAVHFAREYATPRGIKMSPGIWPNGITTGTDSAHRWDTCRSFVADGNEILIHSIDHGAVSDTLAFSIRYTGAGSACTMTIDTITKHLTTTVTGASGNLDVDLSNDSVSQLSKLITAINKTPYTVVGLPSCNTSGFLVDIYDSRKLLLKQQNDIDIKTAACSVSFNIGKLYYYQIAQGKNVIESHITGYSAKTFMTPCGTSIDTALRAMRGYGFTSNRNTATATLIMDSINLYKLPCQDFTLYSDTASDSVAQRDWYTFADLNGMNGLGLPIYSHGIQSVNRWVKMVSCFDTLRQLGLIKSGTFSDLSSYIRANGTTLDSLQWRVTHIPDSTDLRLLPQSSLRDVGDTSFISGKINFTDAAGTKLTNSSGILIKNKISVGAYEFLDTMVWKSGSESKTSTSISYPCSLSAKYALSDSVKVIFSVSTDKTTWTKKDSSNFIGGTKKTFSATGLNVNQKYYIKDSACIDPLFPFVSLGFSDSVTTDNNSICTLVVIAGTGGAVSRATIIDSTSRTFRDTATANTGYLFNKWTVRHGGVTFADSMSRFAAMTVTASDTVDATFRARPTYTLTMAAGTGGTVLPATGSVDSAASTAISASPGTHYIFQKWTRSSTAATIADSTSATTTVILTGAATVTGNFTCVAPTISYATKITANYKTAITPQSATIGGGGADSVKAITTLPAGLTCTKTGVNAGQITGTPTVLAAKAGYLIRAYGCDSADTYDTITVSDNVPVITSATPSHRPTTTAGNDTLRGSWLANIDTVWYGTTASTTFWAQTDTTAIVAIPNHAAGVVSIIARNTAGRGTLVNGFEYKNLWINSVAPSRIKAGDTVAIHAAYGLGTSGLGITVGDSTATIVAGYQDTMAKFIAPGYLTGIKKVTATNAGSDTCSAALNYIKGKKGLRLYKIIY